MQEDDLERPFHLTICTSLPVSLICTAGYACKEMACTSANVDKNRPDFIHAPHMLILFIQVYGQAFKVAGVCER
jgi:hypothetical protein